MWLPWTYGVFFAAVLAALTIVLRRDGGPRALAVAPFASETAIVLALYSLWRYAGYMSPTVTGGSARRGRQIWDLERALHLPSEVTWQRAVLPYPTLVKFFNLFYASAHVPVLIAFLIWLFVRHRSRFPQLRNVLAGFTGVSLMMHIVPVAPPRLLSGIGIVDTGIRYGQSVYANGLTSQLAAMPSVHCGWAIIVGLGVVWASDSRWRWWALAYPALTTVAVVVTGNHYWLDAIVAVILIAAVAVADEGARRVVRRWFTLSRPEPESEPQRERGPEVVGGSDRTDRIRVGLQVEPGMSGAARG
ncbi:MAG: hypothetical protein JWL73_756 [Actinomycetia bacterium]|nr:hypothetical protein [Actinomycetes bacterium]